MVMCIVVDCASKSDTAKGVGMFRIPSVIYNQGEETEELTRMRGENFGFSCSHLKKRFG